jgi:hypothetical protein
MIHHGMLWVHVHHVPDVLENWEWSADGQSIHGQFYVFFLMEQIHGFIIKWDHIYIIYRMVIHEHCIPLKFQFYK